MSDKNVSWETISKNLLLPVMVLGVSGFVGWTASAITEVRQTTEQKIHMTNQAIVNELALLRNEIQSLKVEITKLQVEARLQHGKDNKNEH